MEKWKRILNVVKNIIQQDVLVVYALQTMKITLLI